MVKYEKDTDLIGNAVTYMVSDLHEYDLKIGGVVVSSVPRKVIKMFDNATNAKTPEARRREFGKLEDYLRKLREQKKVDFKFDDLVKEMRVSYEVKEKLRSAVRYSDGTVTGALISAFGAYRNAQERELSEARANERAQELSEASKLERENADVQISQRGNERVQGSQREVVSMHNSKIKTKTGPIISRHSKSIDEEKRDSFASPSLDTSKVLKEMKKAMKGDENVNFSVDLRIRNILNDFVLLNKLLNQKDADPEMIKGLLVEQVCAFNDLRCKKCNEQERLLLDVYYNFNPLKVLAKYEKKYPDADVREAINDKMVTRLDELFGYNEYYGIQEYNLDRDGLSHMVALRTELMTPSEISSLYGKYSDIRKNWDNLQISQLQNIFTSSIKYNVEYERLIDEKATNEEKRAEDYMICAVYFGEIPARFENREELVDYINNNVSDANTAAKMTNSVMAVENLKVTKVKLNDDQYGTGTNKK